MSINSVCFENKLKNIGKKKAKCQNRAKVSQIWKALTRSLVIGGSFSTLISKVFFFILS